MIFYENVNGTERVRAVQSGFQVCPECLLSNVNIWICETCMTEYHYAGCVDRCNTGERVCRSCLAGER